jgi:predicted nuclease of predicted toxin-antitoxin system
VKLLLDENLSPRLVELLRDLYSDVIHVRDIGLASANDDAIWRFAASNARMIVTKDEDFNQRAFLIGPPPKVVWLRVGNATTPDISQLLRKHYSDIAAFKQDLEAALLALK